jgi:hypothetical protein
MEKRNWAIVIHVLFVLGAVSLLMNCSPEMAVLESQLDSSKDKSMNVAIKTESTSIPPIDAAVPSNFETASFGLG